MMFSWRDDYQEFQFSDRSSNQNASDVFQVIFFFSLFFSTFLY